MKQGKHYLSIVIWIFLAAIVAYFGYNLATSLYTPLTTTTAVEYEAGAGYYATGFVARDESVIRSNYAISVLTVSEGQRVAAGGQVATGYLTDDAQARQGRIQELTDQLAQLRYAWQYSSSVYDQAQLDKQISESLISLNQYVCRRDMNSAGDLISELKGMVLRRSSSDADSASLQEQIDAAERELETLQEQSASDTKAVTVSAPGYFSGTVDGYESVLTVDALETMTAQDYPSIGNARLRGHRQADPRRHVVLCDPGAGGGREGRRGRGSCAGNVRARFLRADHHDRPPHWRQRGGLSLAGAGERRIHAEYHHAAPAVGRRGLRVLLRPACAEGCRARE